MVSSMSLSSTGQTGEFLEQGSSVLGVADAVYDRVVDSDRLGEDGAPDGSQGGKALAGGEDTAPCDAEVWGPCNEPQADGHHGDLLVRAKTLNIYYPCPYLKLIWETRF